MKDDRVAPRRGSLRRVVDVVGSSRLALVLVSALILLSVAGATLPQEGAMSPSDIAGWKAARPALTRLLQPLGLFRVFSSWIFLITILALGLNLLACTAARIAREGAGAFFFGVGGLRRTGFVLVHLCLLGLFAGGAWSAGFRMDGFVVLTEGQSFTERHDQYLQLFEAPLRPDRHRGFRACLEQVHVRYVDRRFPIDVSSELTFVAEGKEPERRTVRVNAPVSFRGVSFTQDKTGFSPKLEVSERHTGKTVVNSFVALQATGPEQDRTHRDFLPLPFLGARTIITLYPSHVLRDGDVSKTGEDVENPILVVDRENVEHRREPQLLALGSEIVVDRYTIRFTELRRWSSYRVSEDPGCDLVMGSLWIGILGLVLRYGQDIRSWFTRDTGDRAAL